jgi:hypothetical protein
MGAFMVSALQKQLSAAREAGGQALASELAQSSNGRRLLQVRAVALHASACACVCWLTCQCWC